MRPSRFQFWMTPIIIPIDTVGHRVCSVSGLLDIVGHHCVAIADRPLHRITALGSARTPGGTPGVVGLLALELAVGLGVRAHLRMARITRTDARISHTPPTNVAGHHR